MHITIIPHNKSTQPEVFDGLTFTDLAELLLPHTKYEQKEEAPLFSPAEWIRPNTRKNDNVKKVHFGVIDLDKIDQNVFAEFLNLISGYNHLYYSTWTHPFVVADGLVCARVLLELNRPVIADEWPKFHASLLNKFGSIGDQSCKDSGRFYYAPSSSTSTSESLDFFAYDINPQNKVVDVDDVLLRDWVDNTQRSDVTIYDIKQAINKYSKRRTDYYVEVCNALTCLVRGEPFAEVGERDNTLFKITGFLAREFPHINPESLQKIFAPSLARMFERSTDAPRIDEVINKFKRHQIQRVHELQIKEQDRLDAHKQLVLEAFGGTRDTDYTDDEINEFCKKLEVSRTELMSRWVIQDGRHFYLFLNGNYTPPIAECELQNAAIRDLAPARSAGVKCYKINSKGEQVPKVNLELVRDYGAVAYETETSLIAQNSHYNPIRKTFIRASCPLRKIEPEYHEGVARWLELIGGDEHDTLLDWLVAVTRLDKPCAALLLVGAPGAGKTLLAEGVARLWTTRGATLLEQAMSNFNLDITKCPLILGDERIPRDSRGRTRTEELRQFIQARVRPLTVKYMNNSIIEGAIRLIMTSNNMSLLNFEENLTDEDIEAIVDRIIFIKVGAEPKKFLVTQNTAEWVNQDLIAKHVLWLTQNRVVNFNTRFLVQGKNSELHQNLLVSSGLRSAVCHWLLQYLDQPDKYDRKNIGRIVMREVDGEMRLCVSANSLLDNWEIYKTNIQPPTIAKVGKALSNISHKKKFQIRASGTRVNLWVVDTDKLRVWNRMTNLLDDHDFEQKFNQGMYAKIKNIS